MEKQYNFRPEFLEFSAEEFIGIKLHAFQVEIRDIMNNSVDCLFLSAPTGSGKTLAFALPSFSGKMSFRRPKTMIISPTNVLISQTKKDIESLERKMESSAKIKLKILNSMSILSKNRVARGEEIRESFTLNDIIISNPDIISLLLSDFYHPSKMSQGFRVDRIRNPEDIFSELNVLIFDEYHVYSDEEIGKVVAFMILSRMTGNKLKFIFSSATPNSKIITILEKLGFTVKNCKVDVKREETENCRKIKGEISLIFTNQPISKSVSNRNTEGEEKTLYLFNHKIEAEIAITNLLSANVPIDEIREITGFYQRSSENKIPSGKERYIIATNSAEQGLNLDVSCAHIEPGLFIENLSQRYGRIGRAGASGIIFVHVDEIIMKHLPDSALNFSDLIEKVENIFRSQSSYEKRIKIHTGAFLALSTVKAVRPQLGEQIKKSVEELRDIQISATFNSVIDFNKDVYGRSLSKGNANDIKEFQDWWEKFLTSIGFFRGQNRNVKVILVRNKGELETTDDIVWIKKFTEYNIVKDNESNKYCVTKFLEIPKRVTLKFILPGQTQLNIDESDLSNFGARDNLQTKFFTGLQCFLIKAFDDFDDDLEPKISRLNNVLKILYPGMVVPSEVENVSELQIL